MSPSELLILLLGVVGLLWYYVCLISIGLKPLAKNEVATAFRQFQSLSVTTISVSLATFVGGLLGLQQVEDKIADGAAAASLAAAAIKTELSGELQWWSVGLYILSLVVAMVFWHRSGDKTDPSITNLAKSLLGLIGGALSIVLKAQVT